MTLDEYKKAIRKCTIRVVPGGGSDNFREQTIVDWAPYFGNPGVVGQEFLLGIDPTLPDGAGWIDASFQWAPAPAWAQSESYITELEARVAELEIRVETFPGIPEDK